MVYESLIDVKEHSDLYANRPYFLRWISAIFSRSKIICRGDSPLNRVKIPRMFPLPPSRAAQTIWANRTKMTVRINLKFMADLIFFNLNLFLKFCDLNIPIVFFLYENPNQQKYFLECKV